MSFWCRFNYIYIWHVSFITPPIKKKLIAQSLFRRIYLTFIIETQNSYNKKYLRFLRLLRILRCTKNSIYDKEYVQKKKILLRSNYRVFFIFYSLCYRISFQFKQKETEGRKTSNVNNRRKNWFELFISVLIDFSIKISSLNVRSLGIVVTILHFYE